MDVSDFLLSAEMLGIKGFNYGSMSKLFASESSLSLIIGSLSTGNALTTGIGNIFLGPAAGATITSGNENIMIGGDSGRADSEKIVLIGTDSSFGALPNNSWCISRTDFATFGGSKEAVFVKSTLDCSMGSADLVNGTVTVNNVLATANSYIFVSRAGVNASTALGELVAVSSAGSFTISARSLVTPGNIEAGDLSSVRWRIVEAVPETL